jgi:pSer/pThr/pTyr-binding forkhead associated (FHA) protein
MSTRSGTRSGPGRLVFEEGPRAGTVFPIVLKHLLIGRIDSAQLVLDDPTVSRLHARLDVLGDVVTLTDLDSREGTWVNGEAVHSVKLQDGDRIALGDAVLVFQRS